MKPQEAHEYLEDFQRNMTHHREAYSEKLIEANGQAILALEKQIPKKPVKISEDYNAERGIWVADYECPSCGNPYADDTFCSCCGQALDWGDSE